MNEEEKEIKNRANQEDSKSTLSGIALLLSNLTVEITNLVETVHNRIVHPSYLPSTPIQHLISKIAGISFRSMRWGSRKIGKGLSAGFEQLEPSLGKIKGSKQTEAMRSALNGIAGDYLENSSNALSIKMQFRSSTEALSLDKKCCRL